MEQLLNLLEKVSDDSVKGKAFDVFKEIATKLMSEYAIKKGGDLYQMVEIEFYWYSPNHPDLSVYPRKSAAGNWFLHPRYKAMLIRKSVSCVMSGMKLRRIRQLIILKNLLMEVFLFAHCESSLRRMILRTVSLSSLVHGTAAMRFSTIFRAMAILSI